MVCVHSGWRPMQPHSSVTADVPRLSEVSETTCTVLCVITISTIAQSSVSIMHLMFLQILRILEANRICSKTSQTYWHFCSLPRSKTITYLSSGQVIEHLTGCPNQTVHTDFLYIYLNLAINCINFPKLAAWLHLVLQNTLLSRRFATFVLIQLPLVKL